jgi:hypothetical protein
MAAEAVQQLHTDLRQPQPPAPRDEAPGSVAALGSIADASSAYPSTKPEQESQEAGPSPSDRIAAGEASTCLVPVSEHVCLLLVFVRATEALLDMVL